MKNLLILAFLYFNAGIYDLTAQSAFVYGPTECVPAARPVYYFVMFDGPFPNHCSRLKIELKDIGGTITYTNASGVTYISTSGCMTFNNSTSCNESEPECLNVGTIGFGLVLGFYVTWNIPATANFKGKIKITLNSGDQDLTQELTCNLVPRKPTDISSTNLGCSGGTFSATITDPQCSPEFVSYRWWKKSNGNDWVVIENGSFNNTINISDNFNKPVGIRVSTVIGLNTAGETVSAYYEEWFSLNNSPTYISGPSSVPVPSQANFWLDKYPIATSWSVTSPAYIVASTPLEATVYFLGSNYSYTIVSNSTTNCEGNILLFKFVTRSGWFDNPDEPETPEDLEENPANDRANSGTPGAAAFESKCLPDQLLLVFQNAHTAKNILVADMAGRILFQQETDLNELAIDTATFPKGIYAVSVVANGTRTVEKIVVR